jgi:hypothetical protein
MKKSILIILSVFFFFNLQAQDRNLRLGFEAGVVYADAQSDFNIPRRVLQADLFPGLGRGYANGPAVGFAAGFISQYELSDWIQLSGRLTFSNLATEIEGAVYERGDDTPFIPNRVKGTANLYYLDVQLGAKVYTGQSRLQFFVYPFVQSSFYLGNQYKLDLTYPEGQMAELDTATDNTTNYTSQVFMAGLGLGIEYRLSDRISLDLMPSLEYAFNQYSDVENGDALNPTNLGISLGFYYHL